MIDFNIYFILQEFVGISDDDINDDVNSKMDIARAQPLNVDKCVVSPMTSKIEEEIHLPLGTNVTKILDMELPPQDVGNALQFLEFCLVFGEVCLYYDKIVNDSWKWGILFFFLC